jgi:hypothetical protein
MITSRMMRWARHVARVGEKKNAHRLLVGKPDGKRPLRRARRRWLDNIRMDLGEVGWGDVDWIGLTIVNSVVNLRVSENAGKLSNDCTTGGLSNSCILFPQCVLHFLFVSFV